MTTTTERGPAWYAVAVYARQEKAARDGMLGAGFEVFLPLRRVRRAWSDRVRVGEEPFFPGYLFVRTTLRNAERNILRKQRQVLDVLGDEPVRAEEIETLRQVVEAGREVDPISSLVSGTRIRVATGPLSGAVGVVETAPDGARRLVVSVALLGRGVRTLLEADSVVEAAPPEAVAA